MEEILPIEEVRGKFDKEIDFEVYGFDRINDIVKLKPEATHAMGLSIWNRIVHFRRYPVDPMALAKDIHNVNPRIHMRIANIIKRRVVNDICYIHGQILDDDLDYRTVAEMLVAHVYQDELQLCDIEFSNPYQPIPDAEREYEHQFYRGLGLLDLFMENLEKYARDSSCQYITLTAASEEHLGLFGKYGFVVEDSFVGRMAEEAGIGIPMEKSLD